MSERNPYLVLGIDFGTPPDAARRRFALAARRARREGGRWAREDLTWALHAIESLDGDPADEVSLYRVPADPAAFEPAGEGLYKPVPVPLPRRTAPATPDMVAGQEAEAVRELIAFALVACGEAIDVSTLDYPRPQEAT